MAELFLPAGLKALGQKSCSLCRAFIAVLKQPLSLLSGRQPDLGLCQRVGRVSVVARDARQDSGGRLPHERGRHPVPGRGAHVKPGLLFQREFKNK